MFLFPCIFTFLLTGCTTSASLSDAASTEVKPATPVYYDPMEMLYADKVYKDNIRSVVFFNSNSEIAPPIIALNTDEYLTLRFDDTDNNIKTYNYSILHCNADWSPSGLMEIEYLDGYFQGNVTKYEYSFNTYQQYINYRVDFPNSDTKVLLPGNYLMFVYENNDKEKPVLTKRFIVYQQQLGVTHEYKRSDDVEQRDYKQEIDFNVNTSSVTLNQGASDIKVYLLQNYRWDNCIMNLSPKFINNNEFVYNLDEPNTFEGLNEYRHLNITSTKIKGNRILSIDHDSTLYRAVMLPDERRSYKKHMTTGDINGRFKIQRDFSDDVHSQADYMWVTFHFAEPKIKEGDIYLFGQFTNWELNPAFKMDFDPNLGAYTKTILLKQGNYDYTYVVSPNGKPGIDQILLEGTHYDTENQYTILVYYHDIRRNIDLLLGFADFNNYGK